MTRRESSKTARLDIGIWFNQSTGHMPIAAKDAFTVSNDPSSKRYHPDLYRKRAKSLRDANKPHPNPSPEGEGLES